MTFVSQNFCDLESEELIFLIYVRFHTALLYLPYVFIPPPSHRILGSAGRISTTPIHPNAKSFGVMVHPNGRATGYFGKVGGFILICVL